MENIINHVLFLSSQIAYHENQIGWALDDPIKKSRHTGILENLRKIKDFLLNLPSTKTEVSAPPSFKNTPFAQTFNIPLISTFEEPYEKPKNPTVKEAKSIKINPVTNATQSISLKNKFKYSDEYISCQPTTKQFDYKLLNIIISQEGEVTYDALANKLYTVYGLTTKRITLSTALTRLLKEDKIKRVQKGLYTFNCA